MSSDFFTTLSSIPNERGFKMAFLNIVSLPKKIDEINCSMANKFIDLIAFNETRLDANITDNMINIDGYDVVRKDRSRNGGGVCIYLRSSINYRVRNDLVPTELEVVCIEITKPHSKPFLVTTVYRPPSASSEFFDHFEKLIKAIDNENKEMFIPGDLNCDMLKADSDSNIPTKKIKSLYESYQLTQLINEATRVTMTTTSLTDHIVTNTPEKIPDSGVIHTGVSDHSLVFAIRKISIIYKQENTLEIRNMKNFDKEKFSINSLLGRQNKPTVINELRVGENNFTNHEDIAEGFNEYFSNIGPNLASNIDSSNYNFETHVKNAKSEFAAFQHVTVSHVSHLLLGLSSNKATGIDKISCKIIKLATPVKSDSLTLIFNQAITLSSFPDEWKIARVIPLYKNGQRNIPGNYRPISVLPAISKIMERILYDQLHSYLTTFELLSDSQFGFRKSHSTASALLDCTNEWYVNLDRKMFNLVVLIDLRKAFDTVDHQILLRKLELYGIKGQALTLLRSYLTNRNQKCQIKNSFSSERLIKCGVRQGSILGPLFFLLYINDLPHCLNKTKPRMFADDTNLTALANSLTDLEAAANSDLENLRK